MREIVLVDDDHPIHTPPHPRLLVVFLEAEETGLHGPVLLVQRVLGPKGVV